LGRRISADHAYPPLELYDRNLSQIVKDAVESGKTREALRKIQQETHSKDAPTRAAYHCAAGNLAVSEMKRPSLAVGFYLRALRVDPRCVSAIDRLREILSAQKRLKRFERTCWEVLGRLGDDEVGSEMWVKCWSGLAAIYSATPRLVRRSDAIRKLLDAVATEDSDVEKEISKATSDIPRLNP